MAEMLVQSESLTAIADKIRVLSDTEDAMSLSTMESHVDEANTDVATEADLIEQISVALESKANGSGNGGIQWISCSTIPTTYAVVPGSQAYYIELPHENCYVLFFNPNKADGNGCHLGCYDVKARVQTMSCHLIYNGELVADVINDSGILYLQLTSKNISHTSYYAIISESLLPLKEVI